MKWLVLWVLIDQFKITTKKNLRCDGQHANDTHPRSTMIFSNFILGRVDSRSREHEIATWTGSARAEDGDVRAERAPRGKMVHQDRGPTTVGLQRQLLEIQTKSWICKNGFASIVVNYMWGLKNTPGDCIH